MEGSTRRSSEFVNPKLSRRPTPFVLVGRPSSISLCSEKSFARAKERANVFAGSNIDVSETSIVSLGSSRPTCKPRLASLDDSEASEESPPISGRFVAKSSLRILPPLVETLPNTSQTDQVKKLSSEDTLSSRTPKINTSHLKASSIHPANKKDNARLNPIVCKYPAKPVNKGRAVASHSLALKKPVLSQKKPVPRLTEKMSNKKVIAVVPPILPKRKSSDIVNLATDSKPIKNKNSSSSLSESSRDDSVNSCKDDPASASPGTKMREIAESCDDSDIPSVSTRCSPISATLTNASDPLAGEESNMAKSHARFDIPPTLNRRKLRTASRIRSPSISDSISSRRLLKDDHSEAANRRFSIGDWNKQKAINLRRGSLRPCTQVDFIECQRIFATDRYSSSSKHHNTPPFSSNVKTQNLLGTNYLKARNHSNSQARNKSIKQLPPLRKTCRANTDNGARSRRSRNRDLIQTLVNDEAADSSASKSVSIGSHSDSPCTSPSSPSLLITRPLTVFSTSVSAAATPVSSSACSQVLITALTPISATSTSSCQIISPTLMSSTFSLQPPLNSSCEPVDDLRSCQSLSSIDIASAVESTSAIDSNELSHFSEKEKENAKKDLQTKNLNIQQSNKSNYNNGNVLISNIKEAKISEITSATTLNGSRKSDDIPVKENEDTKDDIPNDSKCVEEKESSKQPVSPVGDELSSLPDFYKHIQRRSSSIDSVMSRPGSDFLDVPLFPLQSRDRSPSSSTLDESESPTMSPPFNVSCSEGADLQQQVVHRLSDAIQLPCPTPCQTPDLESGTPGFVLSTPFLPKVVEQVAGPQVSLTTEDGDDFAVWFGRRGSIFIEEKTSPGTVPTQASLLATRTTTNEQGQVSLDVPKTIDNTRPL